jgi:hypothetical protein
MSSRGWRLGLLYDNQELRKRITVCAAQSSPIQVWFRDLMMPFLLKIFANPAALDWIYSYPIDWDERIEQPAEQTGEAVFA